METIAEHLVNQLLDEMHNDYVIGHNDGTLCVSQILRDDLYEHKKNLMKNLDELEENFNSAMNKAGYADLAKGYTFGNIAAKREIEKEYRFFAKLLDAFIADAISSKNKLKKGGERDEK